jgi:hypothetical protein
MAGRNKIVGNDKCPHINKKTGIPDCHRAGRYNPKAMISWNTKEDIKS